ncbi:MAG: QueT transporter family protein [Acidaminobacteraceae bacterium]
METKKLVKLAIVASLYFVLTVGLAPISYGSFQFRVSEVMTLLAFIDPFYIPGLVLGTVLANLFSPLGFIDVIFGTVATFISVFMMSRTKNIFLASLWPVVVNGVIIGIELFIMFGIPLVIGMTEVAIGEFVVVSIVGVIIFKYGILNNPRVLDILKNNK